VTGLDASPPTDLGVDPNRWIAFLEERKAEQSNPVHAEMVGIFIEHLHAEQAHDVERFLAHQVEQPLYRRFGAVEWHLPPNVREWFGRMATEGSFPAYEMETDRFLVGDDGIATDGILKMTTTGRKLRLHDMELPDGGGDDDTFVVYRRFAIFIPFENGKMAGEDTYRDPPTIVKV
jgi:hypothetical protein